MTGIEGLQNAFSTFSKAVEFRGSNSWETEEIARLRLSIEAVSGLVVKAKAASDAQRDYYETQLSELRIQAQL